MHVRVTDEIKKS